MGYKFYIDPTINCVFIQHDDDFQVNEDTEVLDEIIAQPEYREGMNILRDFRQASMPNKLTEKSFVSEGRQRIHNYDIHFGKCRIAAVVSSPSDFQTLHRWMTSTRLTSNVERQPYRDINAARAWLRIPEDYEIKFPTAE